MQSRSYALLPGNATEKVAIRWMKDKDKDKRAGAFRLFWVALAKIWRAGLLPIGQRASTSTSVSRAAIAAAVSVRARNYTWRVDGQYL